MKKTIALLVSLMLFVIPFGAFAADMGVQIIGGPETESEPVSLDDIKLNTDVTIDGYGVLTPTEFAFKDRIGYYKAGKNEVSNWGDCFYYSGNEADYALLRVDITNIATIAKDYLASCEVKVVFDDVYEYAGWADQYNYNNATYKANVSGEDSEKQNTRWIIDESDHFSINPMYQGHYVFGCTLPNAVVSSKSPLKMVITIDGNEITYNIRK